MDRWRREGRDAARGAGTAHVHLAGVAGRGMAGLAQMLAQQRRVVVTGSERHGGADVERLRRLGVRVHVEEGTGRRPCPRTTRWLVHGAEIDRVHPERLSAARRGLGVRTPAQCLGAMMRRGVGLAMTGGRTASVAAAMTGWILTRAGLDPTVLLGSAAPQLGGWARLGGGPHVLVGAVPGVGDGWGALAPRLAVFLDVETADEGGGRIGALRALADSVPDDGLVLAWAGSPAASSALEGQRVAVEWFGLERGADWWGADLREDRGCFRFRAFHRGQFVVEVRLPVPGRRNVLAALAAVAACGRLDVPAAAIRHALEEFTGVSRDFESRGSYRGVTLIDDGGQGPAAVGEALGLGRRLFGARRIWAVLLATGAPESEAGGEYTRALALADEVVLIEGGVVALTARRDSFEAASPTTASGLTARPTPSATGSGDETAVDDEGRSLASTLESAGRRPRRVASLDDAIDELDRHLEPGDVLVTLGAGDVGTISDAFFRRLPRDRPGR